MDVPDLTSWSAIARESGIPLVVDSTLSTPALLRARDTGAALSMHSATKFLTGNGTIVAGGIVDLGTYSWKGFPGAGVKEYVKKAGGDMAFLAWLRKGILQNVGGTLSPFNAFLGFLGMETLELRMERHSSNALALAGFLENREDVVSTAYPGLPSWPWHGAARSLFGERFGGLLSFRAGSRERAYAVLGGLKLAANQTNLGDSRTLAIHPASTIYRDLEPEQTAAAGVTDDMIRVSVGLESPRDIIDDFQGALDGAEI
jgi:O-acetylhomoserine (thiol)-lyase